MPWASMKHASYCKWAEPLRCECGLIQRIKYSPGDAAKVITELRAERDRLRAELDAIGGIHTCSPGCEKTALCRMTNERNRLAAKNAEYETLLRDVLMICNSNLPWMYGLKQNIRLSLEAEGGTE